MPDHDQRSDRQRLREYSRLTDQLMQDAPAAILMDCLRVMATTIAHYEASYGALPLDDSVFKALEDHRSEETVKLAADGMQHLAGILAVMMGLDRNTDNRH